MEVAVWSAKQQESADMHVLVVVILILVKVNLVLKNALGFLFFIF